MFDKEYTDYIKSERWKLVCEKFWIRNGRRCQACGTGRGHLHVHHKSYDLFKREPLSDLAGLCTECHKEVHRLHRRDRRMSLRLVTDSYIRARRAKR